MIYADFNGSAPLCDEVKNFLIEKFEKGPFANPNASHRLGQQALMGMENARAICSKNLGCLPKQIVFNSGSTEGISTIFHTLLFNALKEGKTKIIISGIEHPAITRTAEFYASQGHQIEILKTLESGLVDSEHLKEILSNQHESIAMVSVMAANNETGVIQPFHQIATLCKQYGVPYFCDTTQIIGKAPFNFAESDMDYAVLSGHKIGALTGTGLVMAKDPNKLRPLIIGGGQERNLRGGTQNYIGNESMAIALNTLEKKFQNLESLNKKREEFEARLKKDFPQISIIGEEAPRLATTTYVSFPGLLGGDIQRELEKKSIYVTTSSACCDVKKSISKILQSMNVSEPVGMGVIRISLSPCSPTHYYDNIFDALREIYNKLSDKMAS